MKLQGYLDKLIALSHTDEMVEVVKEMSVKEQFINSCMPTRCGGTFAGISVDRSQRNG